MSYIGQTHLKMIRLLLDFLKSDSTALVETHNT